MNKTKMAVLIGVMLATPAAVVAVEQATIQSSDPVASVEMSTNAAQPTESSFQVAARSDAPITRSHPVRAQLHASTAFPDGAESEYSYKQLPALVAYWDRMEQQRSHLAARGDAFPAGSESEYAFTQLPAVVAYWDGIERQRIARASTPSQARPRIDSSASLSQPASATEPARVASANSRSVLGRAADSVERAADFVTRPFRSESSEAPKPESVSSTAETSAAAESSSSAR